MRTRTPDAPKARSLVRSAELEMEFLDTLELSSKSASTIIKGIHENFRKLGEAVLISKGQEPEEHNNHQMCLQALMNLKVKTTRPLQVLDNLRKIRNDINYNGYIPSMADLDDVISIKKACWKPILEEVKKNI